MKMAKAMTLYEIFTWLFEEFDFECVIRCKDCKHWYPDVDSGMACEFTNMSQPEDGFCNWAEQKDGDADEKQSER